MSVYQGQQYKVQPSINEALIGFYPTPLKFIYDNQNDEWEGSIASSSAYCPHVKAQNKDCNQQNSCIYILWEKCPCVNIGFFNAYTSISF